MSRSDDIAFGPFCLRQASRRLEIDGRPVEIGARAFDLLATLAERPGEVLSKRELLSTVWQDAAVDEGALRFAVMMLRRALAKAWDGPDMVKTVAWRGYCLVVPDEKEGGVASNRDHDRLPPGSMVTVTGRETDVQNVQTALSTHRLVTITGPGGIGKTTVGLAVLQTFPRDVADDVVVVDLSSSGSDQVADALAIKLRLIKSADPLNDVVLRLRQTSAIILLDGCEHVIDAVAVAAERILEECPDCFMLATSREALRARGERIVHLGPLAYPRSERVLTTVEALEYSAVQLFCERVSDSSSEFEFRDEEADHVASICRRLNGVPLALELAAARVPTLGAEAVARLLEQSVQLDWRGRRTAPSRHMTLAATLEWSCQLLTIDEQTLLSLLSVFVGDFELQVVHDLPSELFKEPGAGTELLEGLVAKSLVAVSLGGSVPRYRMLDMTVTFARRKMIATENWSVACRWHAESVLRVLERRTSDLGVWPKPQAEEPDIGLLGDVRAALEWAFRTDLAHPDLAIRLAMEADTVFLPSYLFEEAEHWSARALAMAATGVLKPYAEMRLQAAYGVSLLHQLRPADAAIGRSLQLAVELGELIFYQKLVARRVLLEPAIAGVAYAGVEHAVAARDLVDRDADPELWAFASTTLATACGMKGEQWRAVDEAIAARSAIEHLPAVDLTAVGEEARRIAQNVLCVGSWYIGRPGTARRLARETLEQTAPDAGWLEACHSAVMPLCWMRELSSVEDVLDRMLKLQRRSFPEYYSGLAEICKGVIAIEKGDSVDGRAQLWGLIHGERLRWPVVRLIAAVNFGISALEDCDIAEATDAIQIGSALSRQLHGMLETEVLRLEAEVRVASWPDDPAAPELIELARAGAAKRQSPSLALRVALSALRTARGAERIECARVELQEIYSSFHEGLDSHDLMAAAAALAIQTENSFVDSDRRPADGARVQAEMRVPRKRTNAKAS